MHHGLIAGIFAATLWTAAAAAGPGSAQTLAALPGPDGAYDYASVDSAHRRLYVARETSVTAYDLDAPAAPRSLGTIAHGHAALPVEDGRLLLVTSGDDDSVRFLDSQDGREIARIAVGGKPDGAIVDRARGRAYVMNARSGTVTALDLATRTIVGTAALKPGLEFPAIAGSTLFVNNEDENEIETLDLATLTPGAAIALPGCTGPSGLAYDTSSDRLVAACDNGHAAVVDAGRRVLDMLLPIGDGPDAVIADPAHHRMFIPCGKSAKLYEIAVSARTARVTAVIGTASGARTGTIDPSTGRLYLPVARWAPPAPGAKRGAMIPGTFRVLVVGSR